MKIAVKNSRVAPYAGVVIRAVFAAVLFSAFQLFSQYVFYSIGFDYDVNEGLFTFVSGVIVSTLLFIYVRITTKNKVSSLVGCSRMEPLQWVFVVIIAVGMVSLVAIYFAIAHFLSDLIPKVEESIQNYNDTIGRVEVPDTVTVPAWDHVLYLIAIVLVVPLTEELAFRGLVMGELRKKFSPAVAILLSGLVFGLMHGQPVQVGYAMMCGILLGAVYYWCGSIWASYVVHAVFNLLGSGITEFLNSGLFSSLSQETIDSIDYYISDFETFMLIPGIVCFIFLYMLHKNKLTLSKNSEVVQDEQT